jgi:hypothetical protein
MADMGCVIFFILFVGAAVAIGIFYGIASNQRANQAWQAAAAKMRLPYTSGGWMSGRKIEGQYHGHWIKADVYSTGGKNSQTYTRYEVFFPEPLGLGLRLTRQGFFSNLWHLLGGHDIQVGDPEFDADVVVKGRDPDAVIRFLTPARRARIHRLLLDLQAATIDDEKIHWQRNGIETDSDNLIFAVQRLCKVARSLSGTEEDPAEVYPDVLPAESPAERVPQVLPAVSAATEPPEVVPVRPARSSPEAPPEVIPVRPYYEGVLPTAPGPELEQARVQDDWQLDERPRASEPPPFEESPPPSDKPVAAAAPAAAPVFSTPPVAATPPNVAPRPAAEFTAPPVPVVSGPDVAAVCKHLFQGDQMTHRITEIFDQHYKGQLVQWSGILQEVSSFFFDMQFSNVTGTRATLEVGEVAGLFGSTKIQAVLQLPQGLESSLRDRVGQRLTFTGHLIGCDAFMRRLFVADAQLQE